MARPPYKILHMHGTFDLGGKEARVVRLMNIWADKVHNTVLLGEAGHDAARAGLNPDVTAIFVTEPRLGGPPGIGKYRALARYMRDFDLVLSYNWGAMDGVMAHNLFHRIMDLPPLIHHEDGFNADEAVRRKASRNIYRRVALASAHALVVPSVLLERIAETEWGQSVDKVRQIPNGIDLTGFAERPPRTAIPGLTDDGRLVVGTLAGLRPVKNLRRLVRAVAPLRDKVTLVIVGEGEDRAAIEQEAHMLGITSLVMPGHLPRPQEFVGAFDIFALSSDSEQFPISLVEAMAARLPAVSTDVGDVAAMVAPANRPFVVPQQSEGAFADALARLVAEPETRHIVGEANRQRVETCFAEPMMVERYAKLYRTAIDGYHPRRGAKGRDDTSHD